MKIALIAAIYKRYDLTRIFLDYYNQQKKNLQQEGFDLELICVGSEGELSRTMAEENGWRYFEYANDPLSHKIEHAFLQARNTANIKGCVWIGSDDFLEYSLLKYYFTTFTGNEQHLYGLNSMYFYSTELKKTLRYYLSEKCPEKTVGTARFYSKAVLDKMDWMICAGRVSRRGIDSYAFREMKKKNISDVPFTMEQSGICVDIKTDTHMTSWAMIQDHPCIEQGSDIIKEKFPFVITE